MPHIRAIRKACQLCSKHVQNPVPLNAGQAVVSLTSPPTWALPPAQAPGVAISKRQIMWAHGAIPTDHGAWKRSLETYMVLLPVSPQYIYINQSAINQSIGMSDEASTLLKTIEQAQ